MFKMNGEIKSIEDLMDMQGAMYHCDIKWYFLDKLINFLNAVDQFYLSVHCQSSGNDWGRQAGVV